VRFSATVEPAGNATGVEVPAAVVNALGSGRRPEVVITIGGHTWRSRIASMDGRFIVGISAANRAASGIAEGDVIEVGLRLDAEPRVVAEPPDLADALDRAASSPAQPGPHAPRASRPGPPGAARDPCWSQTMPHAGWSMVTRPLTSTGAWRPPAVWLDTVPGSSGTSAADVTLI
jgi:hypothetical protein